jgi:hypothetical protein
MDAKIKAEWVRELEENKTPQCVGKLGTRDGACCVLGVLERQVVGEKKFIRERRYTSGSLSADTQNKAKVKCGAPELPLTEDEVIEVLKTAVKPDVYATNQVWSTAKESLINTAQELRPISIYALNDIGVPFPVLARLIEEHL